MTKASGCLDQLSTGQRRVLTLRAGIGAGPPRSRSSTARRLDTSVKRVRRLERAGLRRLRELSKSGGCAPPTTTSVASGMTVAAGEAGPQLAAAPASEGGKDRGSRGGDESEGTNPPSGGVDTPEDEAPPSSGGGVAGVSETNRPGESGGLNILIPLLLLLMLLLAMLVSRLRRRREEPVPAPPPEEPKPVWTPWRRSPMTGPSWNEAPPPSREDSWAESPSKEPAPQLEHEPWMAPRPKRPVL